MYYAYYKVHSSAFNSCVGSSWDAVAVVPEDDFCDPLALEDPARARTSPTPPVVQSPSASPAPMRHRAMAHLRPVSIPALVSDMAGKDPTRKIADFDRHYLPDGQPSLAPDASARGNADDHRSEESKLKRKADGISESLSEVFAYLTHGTASLEEETKLLTIITNVNYIPNLGVEVAVSNSCLCIRLDFKPADVKHSSLRTMAKHVRRAMLPGNHEVFKKSLAEGTPFCRSV